VPNTHGVNAAEPTGISRPERTRRKLPRKAVHDPGAAHRSTGPRFPQYGRFAPAQRASLLCAGSKDILRGKPKGGCSSAMRPRRLDLAGKAWRISSDPEFGSPFGPAGHVPGGSKGSCFEFGTNRGGSALVGDAHGSLAAAAALRFASTRSFATAAINTRGQSIAIAGEAAGEVHGRSRLAGRPGGDARGANPENRHALMMLAAVIGGAGPSASRHRRAGGHGRGSRHG
jgi:hypothetical protein